MANIFTGQSQEFDVAKQEVLKTLKDNDLKFMLQYHNLRLENIYDFLHSFYKIMAFCGFQASGKKKIIQTALAFLSDNVCKINIECAYSICLDDILLFIHNKLLNFCEKNKIAIKKPPLQDFKEIVTYYLKQLNTPIVLVLNSFEHCMSGTDKDACIEFLKYLTEFENIKVIISARQLNTNEEPLSELGIQKIISKSLEFDAVKEYFKQNGYEFGQDLLEKFYDLSRGYFGYVVIVINILRTFSLTLEDFLNEFETREESFDNFLITKLLSISSDNTRNLLNFLAIVRVNFPIKLILSLNFATQDEIDYLINKGLVETFEESIYIKEFIKNAVLREIKTYTKYKIHKFLSEFFENQLPLKPKDRAIKISRQTMRAEVKYHGAFVKTNTVQSEQTQNARLPKTVANMSYISYSRGLKNKLTPDLVETMENYKFDAAKSIESAGGTIFEFSSEDEANILKDMDDTSQKHKAENKSGNPDTISTPNTIQQDTQSLLKIAQDYEKNDDLSNANKTYINILDTITDEKQTPVILTHIGKNSQKNHDYTNAIDYFEKAYEIYERNGDNHKANYILLHIADLYKDIFKFTKAKNIYYQILTEENITCAVRTKCYLGLIDIESNQNNRTNFEVLYHFFDKIFENLDKVKDTTIKAEVYFKYALLKDDENNTKEALNFYQKSIETCNNKKLNLFLSSCYSNIASIYVEKDKKELALRNFETALEIDKENNNAEGIYYCNLQIAELLQYSNKNLARDYYMATLKATKNLNDNFYIATAHLSYGDFCYQIGDNRLAIKEYLTAKKYVNEIISKDNIETINVRLNDLKIKMGKDKYLQAIQEFQNNE